MASLISYKGYDLEIVKSLAGDWIYTIYNKSGMALAYARTGGFDTKAQCLAAAKIEACSR